MRWKWPVVLGVAVLGGTGVVLLRQEPAVPDAPAALAAPGSLHFLGPLPAATPPGDRAARRAQLREQVRLTDHTYCSYLAHSRYPHTSRPAGHHPDQLYPNQPVLDSSPMQVDAGDADTHVLLQTSQSRVYLAAGESARFALRAVDARGQVLPLVLPLVVTRALAQGMTYGASRPAPRVALVFEDDGNGTWHAVLAPGQTGLAAFHGTIRLEVRYSAGGRAGHVLFDVVHSPVTPATWAGPPRDAVAGDGLRFSLPLAVRLPGRYVVSGRIDDARGRPFALATFNEELAAGTQQVTLSVHGKLLHDGDPPLPLVLRDVEGYLLRENADPDRLLLPRREGRVLASGARSLAGVPDEEWHSEERDRYLAEYAKDRSAARAAMTRFDAAAPLPPGDCAQNGRQAAQ